MKIIKQGLSKEELVKLNNVTKKFECRCCGCIFEADKSEYKSEEDYIYTHYYSYCPNCGQVAFENRML
jgi:Zn finger protein HypA/HybF involved in hydrogenase expression